MLEPTDFEMADEISRGMRARVVEHIQHSTNAIIGVVFSSADVLVLLDAYDELRQAEHDRARAELQYPFEM